MWWQRLFTQISASSLTSPCHTAVACSTFLNSAPVIESFEQTKPEARAFSSSALNSELAQLVVFLLIQTRVTTSRRLRTCRPCPRHRKHGHTHRERPRSAGTQHHMPATAARPSEFLGYTGRSPRKPCLLPIQPPEGCVMLPYLPKKELLWL